MTPRTHTCSVCWRFISRRMRILPKSCVVNVLIKSLIWTRNANHTGARLSYVNKFAESTASWLLEPSEELLFVLFKRRLKSLFRRGDISDKLFWRVADSQRCWITLSVGPVLIDTLTWKKMCSPKTHPLPPFYRSETWHVWTLRLLCSLVVLVEKKTVLKGLIWIIKVVMC